MSKPESEVRVCDRCGQYYETSEHDNYGCRYTVYLNDGSKMDLCSCCYGILENILSNNITRDTDSKVRDLLFKNK